MDSPAVPIQAVVLRTGLSAHLIRIWEKRYGAVVPNRTATNRRRYSENEIRRLELLRDLTRNGHSIGSVAAVPTDRLERLAGSRPQPARPAAEALETDEGLIAACLGAVKSFDSLALDRALNRAALVLGGQGMLQRVAAPLAGALGEHWREGRITAAHEHFFSAALKGWLTQAARSYGTTLTATTIVVATPAGQLHELGALLFATSAAHLGWRVVYLGPSLQAADIAGAAQTSGARAVALSIVHPDDDPALGAQLMLLRSLLPADTALIVGGRAAGAYGAACRAAGALMPADLGEVGRVLDELRREPALAR